MSGNPYAQGGANPSDNYANNPQAFFTEVAEIKKECKTVADKIASVESLRQKSLTIVDEAASAANAAELDTLTNDISTMNKNLAARIKTLKIKGLNDPEKAPQIGNLDKTFKEQLRRYQGVEAGFQRKTRDQMARQYRIVNPDATDEEVKNATENANGPVFSQAVMNSRKAGAKSALAEVQNRHAEIQKIEKTMVELAQLFQDMENLVIEQEPMIDHIEQKGNEIVENTEKANEELGKAVEHAASARAKKWWCMLVVILIIIVLVIIIAAVVAANRRR